MNTTVSDTTNRRILPGDQTPGSSRMGFNRFHSTAMRHLIFGLRAVIFTATVPLAIHADASTNYVAHEWGTFTSVQGGDGNLLPWHSLRVSELPGFVYNWTTAGMNRGPL